MGVNSPLSSLFSEELIWYKHVGSQVPIGGYKQAHPSRSFLAPEQLIKARVNVSGRQDHLQLGAADLQ
jgi:hypothetical protein